MKLNFHYNGTIFSADLPGSMTLADVSAYVEAETGLPPTHHTLTHKFNILPPSDKTTLESSNVQNDDWIIITPFDPIADNLSKAYEETPEFFADVTMLYIKISINGKELPAFIDTGAQRSLITPALCDLCDIKHLIDTRFQMKAKGVGEMQSNGRIHSVPIIINNESCATSLTVLAMDGPGVLIGLDWMKRFKVKIDLNENGIFIGNTFVEFLNEWEVNKLQKENGIKQDMIQEVVNNEVKKEENKSFQTQSSKAPAPAPASDSTSTSALSNDQTTKLNTLIDMGFDKLSALNALKACQWNVDMAAGMLF
ncbi:Ddi1 protein [Pichia kluyveri]|uniref:DNA damage-inducible protein 1 n=1 Tax=Pichia kluyveri TaxID=36015 RepID=A0AAV5R244_PICKL|nr:Ddi1 protein [Pichia kluyveri]